MGRCNEAKTYSLGGANVAYAWLHLLDRYVRTWLALEHLLRDGLLPMGIQGVRVLDIGTGPGPSAIATHDFYVALTEYAAKGGSELWRQPPRVTCVEPAASMNHLRHALAETLAVRGAPQSIVAIAVGSHDFASIRPREERKELQWRLRGKYEQHYDCDLNEWHDELTYTAEEANREANPHRRYRLFTFSNFLTTLNTVSEFESNLEETLSDAQPGSVALMIGGKGEDYSMIQERMARLAGVSGFRRSSSPIEVAVTDARLDGRLAEEYRWFYGHLMNRAGNLPAYDNVTQRLLDELEGRKQMGFGSSAVHAFRK